MKKTHLLGLYVFVFIAVTFLVSFEFLNPIVNDLYIQQMLALKSGVLYVGKNAAELLMFDSVVYRDFIYLTSGLFPSVLYLFFDLISDVAYSNVAILYLHLLTIIIVLINSFKDQKWVFVFSPLMLYFFVSNITSLEISYIYGFTYICAAYFLQRHNRLFALRCALLFAALHCRFGFLPVVLLLYFYEYKKEGRIAPVLVFLFSCFSLLIVNYLKFDNPFFFGETYNKFQGDWLIIFKTLQLDSYSIMRLAYSVKDFFLGVFFNFQGEKMYGVSYAITHINSVLIYSLLSSVIFFRFKIRNKETLLLVVVELLFNIIFVRFYSYRLILLPMFFLILSFDVLKRFKYSELIQIFIFLAVANFLFLQNYSKRRILHAMEVRDEVHKYTGYFEKSRDCSVLKNEFTTYDQQVLSSVYTGVSVVNGECYRDFVSSLLLYKAGESCVLKLSPGVSNCSKIKVYALNKNFMGQKSENSCIFNIKDSYKGSLIFYLIEDFDLNIANKNVFEQKENYGLVQFSNITLECDEKI